MKFYLEEKSKIKVIKKIVHLTSVEPRVDKKNNTLCLKAFAYSTVVAALTSNKNFS